MADLEITGRVTVNAEQAEGALARVGSKAEQMARGVATSAEKAGKAVDGIGDGAGASADKFTRADARMRESIKKSTEQINLFGKTASEKLQFKIDAKGLDAAKFAPYIAELKRAEAAQRSVGDSSISMSNSLAFAARSLAAIGVGVSIREFIRLADASTNVASRLSLVTASAAELATVQAKLFAISQASRVGFVDLAGTYGQIARSTKELGVSQTALLGIINTVSQAVTISGGSADSARAALTQLSQGFASGALRGEELNSVLEQTPRLAQAIAEGFGVGIGQLREMGAAGALTAEAVLGALQRSAAGVETEFNRMALTVDQAATQASNSLLKMVGAIDKVTGSTSGLAAAISAASRGADIMSASIEKLGSQSGLRDAARDVITLDGAVKRVRERFDAGVVGPNTEADLARLVARLADAKKRFNELYEASKGIAPGSSSSANYGNEGAREVSRQAEIARRAKLAEDLNNYRLKSSGVPASYTKDMAEIIRLNQAGVLVGKEYTAALKAQQDVLLGTAKVTSSVAKTNTAAHKEETDALRARIAAGQSQNAAFDEEFQLLEASRLSVEIRIQTGREMLEGIERETALLGLSNIEREKAVALFELERQGVVAGTEAYAAYADRIQAALDAKQTKQVGIDLAKEQTEAYTQGVKKQQAETEKFWSSVDDTAHDTFISLANDGSDAFKTIGKTLKSAVLDMLYQMTIKKWIFQISGQSSGGVGGSGGSNWVDWAQQAYSAYSGGGSSAIVSAGTSYATSASGAAAGNAVSTTTLAGVGAASSGTVTGTSAGAASGAGASSAAGIGWMGYAALIAAAVVVAKGLYEKGWNRNALGLGASQSVAVGQYTNFQSDPNLSNTAMYNGSMEDINRRMGDAIGLSEKWTDILSGSVRMAHLFGRKLNEVGLQADLMAGNIAVSGYAQYKGGVFRSDKTTSFSVDERDAAAFSAQVESFQIGTAAMAQALGYSSDAVENYTGKVKVNYKGAKTAAEVAERTAEAFSDLQFSMLNAAAGGQLSKESFEQMMTGISDSITAAGISAASLTDIMAKGALGEMDASQVGAAMSQSIIGGIYNTIAQNAFGPVATQIMSSLVTPVFTAIMAGVPISQAISQGAIDNIVQSAQRAAEAMNILISNAEFQAAMAGLEGAFQSVAGTISGVSASVIDYGSAVVETENKIAQERFSLETTLLGLLGNSAKLRERERNAIDAANQALFDQIQALGDAKAGVDAALSALSAAIDAQKESLNTQLDLANEAKANITDIFDLLAENIRELRGEVESTAAMQASQALAFIRAATLANSVPDSDALRTAVSSARSGVENGNYSSAFERDRAYLSLANDLAALNATVAPKLSDAEKTIALLQAQIDALDLQLKTSTDQVNALYGIDASVKTVAQAVDGLGLAMASYAAAFASAAGVSVASSAPVAAAPVAQEYYSGPEPAAQWTAAGYLAKNPDVAAAYNSNAQGVQKAFGSAEAYASWHYDKFGRAENRAYARGGYYPGGMALVGEEGPELINFQKPGQVYTAAQTQNLIGGGNNDELVREVRGLREDNKVQARALTMIQARQAKIFDRWNAEGLPQARVEV